MDAVTVGGGVGPVAGGGRRSLTFYALFLGTLAALGPLAIDMYLPAFGKIAAGLGTDKAGMQRTLASYFVGLAVGQLIYGPVADRYGRKRPLMFGLAVFAVTSAACSMAWSVQSLMALRVCQALGGCAEMVIARAIVRDVFDDKDSARVFAALVLVMGLAPILAPLMGGFIAMYIGWRWIFGVLCLAGIVLFFSTLFFYQESLPIERRQRHSARELLGVYGHLLLHRQFMAYTISTGFVLAALFAYVGGSPLVFQGIYHIPENRFALYFGPIAAGIIGMSQVNGRLVSKFDLRTLLRVGHVVNVCAGAALLVTASTGLGGFWGIYVPLWFSIASAGLVFPNATVLAMSPHGRNAGNASAVLGSVQFGVSAIGGMVVSAFQNDAHPSPMPMAVAICGCTALAFVIHVWTPASATRMDRGDEARGEMLAAEV